MYYRLRNPDTADPLWWLLSGGQRGAANWPIDLDGWRLLVDYSEANGLGSVAAREILAAEPDVPYEIRSRLERLDSELTCSTAASRRQATLVDGALRNEEIPVYWLKGVAWGDFLYRELGTRPMRDLDFIVPKTRVEAASKVLEGLGYEIDPLAGAADQHLPRMVHAASGTKIDLHHRIVPSKIYGFPVKDPVVPWGLSNGVMDGAASEGDIRFHLSHMFVHVFHHSFYNLRLLHLFDLKLALAAWQITIEDAVETVSATMPRKVVLDMLGLVGELFGDVDGLRHQIGRRNVEGFIRNGSMPLMYPVTRIEHVSEAYDVVAAETKRAWFVFRGAPGRWGRPTAALHPPK